MWKLQKVSETQIENSDWDCCASLLSFLVIKYCLLLFIYIIYISIIILIHICVFCASLSLSITSAVVGLALVIIVTMARYSFNINHQETLEKQRLITYMTWKLHSVHLESHSEVARRERVRAWARSSTFKVEGGSLGFVFSLLVNLEHKSKA